MKKKKSRGPIIMTMSNIRQQMQRLSAPEKMIAVNKEWGNYDIDKQQGTSRVLYHALPLDGRTLFEFFKDVGAGTGISGEVGRPFNNISENKLQVQESITVRRLYFCVLNVDDQTGAFTDLTDLATAGLDEIYGADYSFQIDTLIVAKPNPLSSQLPTFSKNSNHTTNEWIWLDCNTVIIPELQFQWNLNTPAYTPAATSRLRMVVEGFGSLLSPVGQM